MAQKKNNNNGSWKKERASVNRKGSTKPRSSKYRSGSDTSERPTAGTGERYWRAGYTRRDGTRVKGHYVTRKSQK